LREKGYHFAVFLLFPALAALGLCLGGPWLYLGVVYAFVIHPLLDLAVGPAADPAFAPGERRTAEFLLFLTLPVHFGLLVLGLVRAPSLTPWQLYVAAYTAGLSGGVLGIDAAHEMIHRAKRWQRGVGVALLSLVSYSHFRIEHVFGHHRWVATPRDPASARLGESIYLFWLRSILGGWSSAWKIERELVARKGDGIFSNRMVHYGLMQILFMIAVRHFFGGAGLVFFLIQSATAIWLLETINFIQHYGLERRELSPGGYEPVTPRHSWDTRLLLTNISLFNLGMHARHHESASVPFEELRGEPEAPVLPAGYSAMLLVSLVPPLWRAIMDHRARKAQAA
jgi:alkane 1-monooxygenase